MKSKFFYLWVLVAAALTFTTACSEDNTTPEPQPEPIVPPTISFAGDIAVDETGEWPVAKVEVAVSADADNWYWKFDETRDFQAWTMLEPSRTSIEFPVLYSGSYTLSIYARNAGGDSPIATKNFSVTIPEKYGDVFAAIDWTLNDAKTAVNFTVSTTEATEAWYYEFAEADQATEIPEEITDEIVAKFTRGTDKQFTIKDFEINKTYKMTVIAENPDKRRATSATVGYAALAGEAFAAIDWTLNETFDAVNFTVTTTEATEAWYYEFAKADAATKLPETITEIPQGFTEGKEREFTIDNFEKNEIYRMTVIARNEAGCHATTATVTYNTGGYDGPTVPAALKITPKLEGMAAVTRTSFNGEKILWNTGDAFGVITTNASGEPIQHIRALYTGEPIPVQLAEEATHIYGYYPYNEEYETPEDILMSMIVFDLGGDWGNEYKYASADDKSSIDNLYPMVSGKQTLPNLAEQDEIEMIFRSAHATLVVFNIYGGLEGEKITKYSFETAVAHANVRANLTGDEVKFNDYWGSEYVSDGKWSTAQPIDGDKNNAVKAYAIINKNTYDYEEGYHDQWSDFNDTPNIQITLEGGKSYTYIFEEGLTLDQDVMSVDVDLSKLQAEEASALAEFVPFNGDDDFVYAPSTFVAEVKLKIPDPSKIEYLAAAAIPTENIIQTGQEGSTILEYGFNAEYEFPGSGGPIAHGYFISQVLDSYAKFQKGESLDSYQYIPYFVFLGSMLSDAVDQDNILTIGEDKLRFNGRFVDGQYVPGGISPLEAGRQYTIGVYVKYAAGSGVDGSLYPEHYILEPAPTFTPVKIATDSPVAIALTEPQITGGKATVTASGEGLAKMAAFHFAIGGNENPSDYLTNISNALKSNNARFLDYTAPVALTEEDMRIGQKYVFAAIGIDKEGKLTKMAYKVAEPADVAFTENSKVTQVEVSQQTDFTTINMTVHAENADAIRYTVYNKPAWEDSEAELTFDRLEGWFKQNNRKDYYTTAPVVDGKADITLYIARTAQPKDDSGEPTTNDQWDAEGNYLGGELNLIIFAPVTKGSEGFDLGHLQQLVGSYASNSLFDATAAGDVNKTYYKTAVESELAEKEPDGPGEDATNWFTSTVSFSTGWFNKFYVKGGFGENVTKVWLLKVGTGYDEAVINQNSADSQNQMRAWAKPKIQAWFAAYQGDGTLPSAANADLLYTFNSISSAYAYWEDSVTVMQPGDLYFVVGVDSTGALYAWVAGKTSATNTTAIRVAQYKGE